MGNLRSDVRIIKQSGGLGRLPSSSDYISGLVFYSDTLPSGFLSTEREKVFFSLAEAERAGIKGDSSDATAPTGTIQVTAAGAENETITVTVEGLQIAVATIPAVPTVNTVATAIQAAINDNTPVTGYSATVLTDTVTVTAPKSEGLGLNTLSPVVTHSGTSTSTETAFTGGVGSVLDVLYYHISEYFRIRTDGQLFVGVYAEPTTFDFDEIRVLQNFAKGEIRQCAVWQKKETFSTGQCALINTVASKLFTDEDTPLSVLLAGEISGVDVTTLPDGRNFDYPYVSVIIGQDGKSLNPNAIPTKGEKLFRALGKSITSVGTTLGTVSLANVNESIGYVGAFNLATSSVEYQEPTLANGTYIKDLPISLRNTLSDRAYIYLTPRNNISGIYHNNSYTFTSQTSDFHFIYNERTIDKASRLLRTGFLPLLQSPLTTNPDGSLAFETISLFKSTGNTQLNIMLAADEISAFSITIDPNQDVVSSGVIEVGCKIIPKGVANEIIVPLSFAVQV